jgi:trehalose 6-phosphate synthase/phosphatase
VLVSNRLPVTFHRGARGPQVRRSSGGLVSAIEPLLSERGGTWIGWPGAPSRDGERLRLPRGAYALHAVPLNEREVGAYYHGLCNGTLWPLFHCFPNLTRFDRREWTVYQAVNARFAAAAATVARQTDLIWIRDYHLMLAPLALREALPEARIVFFLHIPFPPYDVFRLLPWDRDLLRGSLACDLVGFHTRRYVQNFLECAQRLLGVRIDPAQGLVEHGNRAVRVGAFPLGIDFDGYQSLAAAAPAAPRSAERVVLGVDRLDYTKGIPERLLAFERLLELHPEHRERVTLVQIAVPSRDQVRAYRRLKRRIDELVGRVNGRFATARWSPIRYLYRSVARERLAALYRDADVALVTPLRDGMNLVAKEFVACQAGDPGVLILSRLAGAAETMREALLVNPYNVDETAAALHRALTMNETERRSRVAALRQRERRYNVFWWLDEFLAAARDTTAGLRPPSDADFEAWLDTFVTGYQLAVFVDYDGTLTPIVDHPAEAVLSPRMRNALAACAARPDIDVAIISGRALADARASVGLETLIYAGNHGMEISGPHIAPFRHPDLLHYEAKLSGLAAELRGVARHGAWVEDKGATLTFHYRAVEEALQPALAAQVRTLIQQAGFQTREAHGAVEARPPIGWDKGHAVLHIARARHGPLWSEHVRIVYVGDDQTDEDAFRILAGLGITFRVGSAATSTHATHRLPDTEAVAALLEWLSRRPVPA